MSVISDKSEATANSVDLFFWKPYWFFIKMKLISDKIIKPIENASIDKGRINRKLIQNIFTI